MIKKFDDNDMQELKDIIRIGTVSSVNPSELTARVKIVDLDYITGDLKILQKDMKPWKGNIKINLKDGETCEGEFEIAREPWLPIIDDWVLCIFKPDGEGDGFVLGGI